MKKVFLFLVLPFAMYSQSAIVTAAGNSSGPDGNVSYSIGQIFINSTIAQEGIQVPVINQVSLSVPKFEIETPKPKPVLKKENFIQKFITFLSKIFKNKKL